MADTNAGENEVAPEHMEPDASQSRASPSSTNGASLENDEEKQIGNGTPGDGTEGTDQTAVQGADGQGQEEAQQPKGEDNRRVKRSKGKIAVIMLALGLGVFLAALDITIVTVAIPTISRDLKSSGGYTWIGSGYLLGSAAATPLWGKFSDIFGRKPVLLAANAVFFVGSLIAALSVNMGMLLFARAFQGIGGGGLISLVNITIGDLFSQRERGAYYGMIGGVWALASSLGPIVGGAFTEKITWRWCFWINLPFDGLAFAIILFFLDVKTPKTPIAAGFKAIDWVGALLIIGGTLMFLMGLQFGGETFPWSSPTVICLIVFGVVTIVLFGLNEWKLAKYPVIPLRLFRTRTNVASYAVCFCQSFVFISAAYFLPLYFQAALNSSPLLSGVYTLATSFSLSVSSVATGLFIRMSGKYVPAIVVGLTLMTLGFGLFIDLSQPEPHWAKIILYQIVAGLGVGPNFQAPLISLQTGLQPGDIGAGTATFGFIRNLASGVSVVIGGVLYANIMAGKYAHLAAKLGPQAARALAYSGLGASTAVIKQLPPRLRPVAEKAFADSLRLMWIVYVVVSALGLVAGLSIVAKVLKKDHVETATGLEAEEENRLAAVREQQARRQAKEPEK